jgi:hypothetical protein
MPYFVIDRFSILKFVYKNVCYCFFFYYCNLVRNYATGRTTEKLTSDRQQRHENSSLLKSPNQLWCPFSPTSTCYREPIPPRYRSRIVLMTIHMHLVPRLKITEIHIHSLYYFMLWLLIKNRDKIAVYYNIIIIITLKFITSLI